MLREGVDVLGEVVDYCYITDVGVKVYSFLRIEAVTPSYPEVL
jgi:hypothetical protein